MDIRESERAPTAPQRKSPADQFEYKQAQVAAAASWEIDFWGKFRQAQNALCILLGMPPGNLDHLLGDRFTIPQAPMDVAVGIPADLLRRRPDIRSAELRAASQSALIGVAKADLYPAFTLTGTFGFLASDVGRFGPGDIAAWSSRYGSFGPSFSWNILNYGQITNNVRVQDARFQELLVTYQNTVLNAQKDVENNLVAFLRSQEQESQIHTSSFVVFGVVTVRCGCRREPVSPSAFPRSA